MDSQLTQPPLAPPPDALPPPIPPAEGLPPDPPPASKFTLASVKSLFRRASIAMRREFQNFKDVWRRLTAGMEIEDMWTQFKTEAAASSRLYGQDVDWKALKKQKSWKKPWEIVADLSAGVLKKLSPPRRLLLLASVVLAIFAIVGVQFLLFTRGVEFLLAFAGVLILLFLVLADHVTMKRDIEIASEIQRWLVPRRAPVTPGVDIAFATRAAKTVAGDYYDAFRRPSDGPLLVTVADVSGKGIPAAMLMASFQASLRALAGVPCSLAVLTAGLNRQVCSNTQNGRFTTAFLAELDPATGDVVYLCAGHNPPILRRKDGTIERLESDCIPLGIELNQIYDSGRTRIEPGDLLVIYTDGVTEAWDESGRDYGEERLLASIETTHDERAAFTLASIMRSVDDFVGLAPQHDDITCMVIRRV
ncbi:MAG: PP2C family protein-serine/threonine phosphatase [Candidatus Acidiferrales bacterium]